MQSAIRTTGGGTMNGRRLTQRLMKDPASGRPADAASDVIDDVIAHLDQLFTTRQGAVPIRPDYGMIDLSDVVHLFPDGITRLRETIRSQIEMFEPRLRDVTLRYVPVQNDPLRLVFHLSATLVAGSERQRIAMHAEMTDEGTLRVVS